jgi:hypothetical protein
LDLIPDVPFDDGLVQAGKGFPSVNDLSDVNGAPKHTVQIAPRDRMTTNKFAILRCPSSGLDPTGS